MRYALLDNSTLTSIQRLLGEIQVKNTAIVDNDILSFENYLQAILFYDKIICIDDYKPEYKEQRLKYFSDIKVVPKSYFDYNLFVKQANKATENVILEVNAGKITDKDFKNYFERLKLNMTFTWDMTSSNFFLTQKILLENNEINYEEFSKIYSMIHKEKNESFESDTNIPPRTPTLIDRYGNVILKGNKTGEINNISDGDGLSPQFQALISSLNWLSQRTAFYVLVADYLYADLFIQPIRQEFLQNIIKRIYPDNQIGRFNNIIYSINNIAESSLKDILKNSNSLSANFSIPLFSAYFAHKTNNPSNIIELAYNERENKEFFEARTKLRELNKLFDEGKREKYITDINLLTTDLNKLFEKIKTKYGVGTNQGFALSDLKFLWSFIPMAKEIKIPKALDPRLKELEFLKHIYPLKGFKAVYRNLVEDLVRIERLGRYKDILTSKINYHKETFIPRIRTEESKYKNISSHWKRPM